MLIHNVFFWLKKDTSASDRDLFYNKLKSLKDIDQAEAVHVGTPANTGERPVIDQSYDYALCVIFKNIKDHDTYQTHPNHEDFIQNCSSLWDKVLVYDAD